jgi:nicotinamide-nucleotide amidase
MTKKTAVPPAAAAHPDPQTTAEQCSPGQQGIHPLVPPLADALRSRGLMVATAESCTGGLIAGACTDIAGSSDWFERGFVSYSNAAKMALLGVPAALLDAHGAVSEPVARAMAAGVLAHAPVALSVAVTGVAGPGGGSADKPVGLVWLAWAWRDAAGLVTTQTLRQQFAGDRLAVRQAAVTAALQGLLDCASHWPEPA